MASDRPSTSRGATAAAGDRIVVGLPDFDARSRLADMLRRADVDIRAVPAADRSHLAAQLARGGQDVVVIRRSQLSARARELFELDDAQRADGPAVVVVEESDDPCDRARLLAGGVSGVVPADADSAALERTLRSVVDAERHGGVGRPEGGAAAAPPRLSDFLSRSPAMRAFLDVVERVKSSDSTLLIAGETGVGKERLARAIHAESGRAAGPFVSVNCGALPEQLLESELFGHERGAFTGAERARPGRFELAQRGTIFLDEIAEMPKHMQVRLLTVLQRREVRPIGADEPRPIDVRVMAATHRDLRAAVERGEFREDLYYRLHVVPLRIPPLRERTEDLPDLIGNSVWHLRDGLDRSHVRGFSDAAMALMLGHHWPGNVRELLNAVERSLLMCRGELVTPADLPAEVGRGTPAATPREPATASAGIAEDFGQRFFGAPLRDARAAVLDEFERSYLAALLRDTGGRIAPTAERAGIHVRSLHDKMKKLGLRKEDFRDRARASESAVS